VPKTVKSRQKKKPQSPRKRRKKGVPPDIGHALLLTAILIGVSAVISISVIGIKSSSEYITLFPEEVIEAGSVEEPAVLATPPEKTSVETLAVEPPPEKSSPVKTAPVKTTVPKTPSPKETPASIKMTAPPELPPQPKHRGTLVFIIDDAGNNLQELEPFLRFSGPLTIAVLPGLPHSAEAARRIRAAGKEVFLHQPMEAIGGQNPGPGAIYAGMGAAEIVAILSKNIAEIGPVAGMNNHQGSKITMDQQIMETVLAFCREQGICFLDSRTSAETAVPAAAR
jgi:hypothetical protein